MADNVTTSFPKMGDSLIGNVVNLSGKKNPNLLYAPRDKGGGRNDGGDPSNNTATHRSPTLIHEANGPACKIIHRLYSPNAASASETQKRTYTIKPAHGDQDFWSARQYNQGM